MARMNQKSMFKSGSIFVLVITLLTVFAACKKEVKPEDAFVKVYNEQGGNTIYNPLSIRKTPDQGYLILSAFDGWKIQLMKIGCIEEIAFKKKWINKAQINKNIKFYGKCSYSEYLKNI
jgi:hypothetical protein